MQTHRELLKLFIPDHKSGIVLLALVLDRKAIMKTDHRHSSQGGVANAEAMHHREV